MNNLSLTIVSFPLWWYTVGLGLMRRWYVMHVRYALSKTGIAIFVRHMGDTLYGYKGRGNKILSFFIRIVLLIIKTVELMIRLVFFSALLIVYLVLPLFIVGMIISQFIPR